MASSLFCLVILATISLSYAHNITQILESDPNLSQFNSYLTQTKLDDEINSRQTITVLALDNSAMSKLTSNNSIASIKNILSLHVLLDYYDPKKLHSIQNGTVLTTTLYQTTGAATANAGSVNITDLKGGTVSFGSGEPGSKLGPTYTKSIKEIPYNISVLEISSPIIAPSVLAANTSADSNITSVLDKAGCKTFAKLISNSGVLQVYQEHLKNGLTIFAPTDEAFKAKGVPDLSKLSNVQAASLLKYHALSSYAPIGTLKSTKTSLTTLAEKGKYGLTPSTAGDSVTLKTGVNSARIADTLLDSTPVVIYSVDKVLLPVELFGSKSPAPAPAPAPGGESPSPAPAPEAEAPSPSSSPPAPAEESPEGSPAGSPAESPETPAADNPRNGAAEGSGSFVAALGLSVVTGVISFLL